MTPDSCCSLDPPAAARRRHDWEAVAAALTGAERTPTGVVLRYRPEARVAERLAELVEAERQCCPALSWSAEVTVRIDAPEPTRAWVVDTFLPPEGGNAPEQDTIVQMVRDHYAAAARRVAGGADGAASGCCGGPTAGIGPAVYDPAELHDVPVEATAASLGCANPVALAELAAGETVLDLGSGGGIDVLLSARRVGPSGKAYGVDMTDEMLEVARANQSRAGVDNVEFLKGRIEAVPLPDASVDVVISNCVLALSTDKGAVFAEVHRVLRPGGRLALADVVADGEPAPGQRAGTADWVACAGGALTREQYRTGLRSAGFGAISMEESHRVADGYSSVLVRATKPEG